MKNIYIASRGKLQRKENTLYFISEEGEKKALPVESIANIFCLNKVSLTHGAIQLLLRKNVCVHFFHEDFYIGSLMPKQKYQAGFLLIKQVQAYLDERQRVTIANEIVDALRYNMIKVLEKYDVLRDDVQRLRNFNVDEEYEEIKQAAWKSSKFVVLSIESKLWNIFYTCLDKILKGYKLEKRTKRPPKNEANAIVSFCNSLLYTTILSEIHKTHLNPTISYLHEPFERRYSLALDFAEPFKPILTYRILIYLVNNDMLRSVHFQRKLDGILLSELGRKLVIKEFDRRINETIKIKGKGRRSLRVFMRKQAYNLERYLIEKSRFEAFRLRY